MRFWQSFSSWGWLAGDWRSLLVSLVMLALAVAVALLIHLLLFAGLVRLAKKPGRVVEASLNRHGRRMSKLLLPLLALLVVLPAAPLPRGLQQGLEHLISIGLIAGVAWSVMLVTDIFTDLVTVRYRVDVADNLEARRIQTQVQVMRRVIMVVVVVVTLAIMLLTIPAARSVGASLLASAGLAGLVVGMAMRPTLGNLVAGVQIALTQPIRLEDAVIVESEWGWIEEITSTYVVVRLWDWRRMVLPLTYFIETPFQNWTRTTAKLLGSVYLYVDYTVPVDELRGELERIVHGTDKWDGHVCVLQVSDAKEHTIELRALADAKDAGTAWDLRCLIREGLIAFLQQRYPHSLPRTRAELAPPEAAAPAPPAPREPGPAPRA